MRFWMPAVLLCIRAFAQPNALTAEEKAAGWQLLFDGHSYRGWFDPAEMNPPGNGWRIEDAAFRTVPNPLHKDDLTSREIFKNFELQFEWRVAPGGNGGVKYLVQNTYCFASPKELPRPTPNSRRSQRHDLRPGEKMTCVNGGLEYQIVDNEGHKDGRNPKTQAGALYNYVAVSKRNDRGAGEWNTAKIIVNGPEIEHWLNGEVVVRVNRETLGIGPKPNTYWTPYSPIVLQHHNDTAWYRSIKVRRLPD